MTGNRCVKGWYR